MKIAMAGGGMMHRLRLAVSSRLKLNVFLKDARIAAAPAPFEAPPAAEKKQLQVGFLVRGVIYDSRALARPVSGEMVDAAALNEPGRDWSNVVYTNLDLKPKSGDAQTVAAADVMERLGLKGVAGVQGRVGAAAADLRKKELQQKQALEEAIGTPDSIRAKYMDKLRQKKMLADAKREQKKFGGISMVSPVSRGLKGTFEPMPGSLALLRYLQERGLMQALLAHGPDEDQTSLLDQLGNFQFQDVKHVKDSASAEDVMSLLDSVCSKWGISSKQVMVVLGGDGGNEVLKSVANKGFLLCRMKQDKTREEQSPKGQLLQSSPGAGEETRKLDPNKQRELGLVAWFNTFVAGTLDQQGEAPAAEAPAHFSVKDMTELKWAIEDLNGVSYRPTTMLVGGFK